MICATKDGFAVPFVDFSLRLAQSRGRLICVYAVERLCCGEMSKNLKATRWKGALTFHASRTRLQHFPSAHKYNLQNNNKVDMNLWRYENT